MHASHEVQISAPITEVFDFLADGANNPRWQPRVTTTAQQGGSLGVGTTFRQRMRHPLGFSVPADYEITAFDRPRTLTVTGTSGGPVRPTQAYELTEDNPGRTTVRCSVDYEARGAGRVLLPFLAAAHPLFAWEAGWIDHARDVLQSEPAARPSDVS